MSKVKITQEEYDALPPAYIGHNPEEGLRAWKTREEYYEITNPKHIPYIQLPYVFPFLERMELSEEESAFILDLLDYDQITDPDYYTEDQWKLQKSLLDKFRKYRQSFRK